MSPFETVLIFSVAALLVIAVLAVRRSPARDDVSRKVTTAMPMQAPPPPAPVQRTHLPPKGSVMTAQLEVGQTVHVQTETARYSLTLRDPVDGLYDAVRIGLKPDGQTATKAFRMLFLGSFVPNVRLMYGWFAIGGRLSYYECAQDGSCKGPSTTTEIQRVIFSIPLKQAS